MKMKFGGQEAKRGEGGGGGGGGGGEIGVTNEGNLWPRSERRPSGVDAGAQTTTVFELAAVFFLLTMGPAVIMWRRRRVNTKAAAGVRPAGLKMRGGAAAAKQVANGDEPAGVGGAAVIAPAQGHAACGCYCHHHHLHLHKAEAAPQTTAQDQPVIYFPERKCHCHCSSCAAASTAMPPPLSCELPLRQPPSPAGVTLLSPGTAKPGPNAEEEGKEEEEEGSGASSAIAAKNTPSAVNKPQTSSCEVPKRQPASPGKVVLLREGPKPAAGSNTESADTGAGASTTTTTTAAAATAAAAAAAAAAKNATSALNSAYQKQIADLHEALQASQKKVNVAEKDLAIAKQAVARALSAKKQKGGEQRATIVRLEGALHEERNEFRSLRQKSIEVSRALGEADEAKAATKKAFAQFKEATQAKVVRLGREASKTKDLERQLARKEFQLKRLKEEVARLRADARAIEGLRETVESKDVEIERMKREWWCARNEARRANRTPCLMVERAAQDILAREAAPS